MSGTDSTSSASAWIQRTGRSGKRVPKIRVVLRRCEISGHDWKKRCVAARNRNLLPCDCSAAQPSCAGGPSTIGSPTTSQRIAGTLDHHAFWIAVKAICRKLDITTAQCVKKYGSSGVIHVDEACQLERFSGISMKLDYRGPEPYEPGEAVYNSDADMEADFSRFNESMRPGNLDLKWRTLQRDQYRCLDCGTAVTDKESQMDHIDPVHCFASFALASTEDNLQTLCLNCHWSKHYAI